MRGSGTLRGLRLSARAGTTSPSAPRLSIGHTITRRRNSINDGPRVPVDTLPSPFVAAQPPSRQLRSTTTLSLMVPSDADGTRDVSLVGPRQYRNSWDGVSPWETPRSTDSHADGSGNGHAPRVSRIPVPRSASVLRPIQVTASTEPVGSRCASDTPSQAEELPAAQLRQTGLSHPTVPAVTPAPPLTLSSSSSSHEPTPPSLPLPPLAQEQTMPNEMPQSLVGANDSFATSSGALRMDEGDLAEAAANAAQVLRVDLGEPSCFEEAMKALRSGEMVLGYLAATALNSGLQESLIWAGLLAETGQDAAGHAILPRSPAPTHMHEHVHASADCSRAEAVAAAVCLRDLLRISICDDGDINLARRVVTDSKIFFTALSTAAAERAVPPSELWNALDALER